MILSSTISIVFRRAEWRPDRGEDDARMSKDFIYGAESLLDLFMRKLTENGGICADCKKRVGELYETLKERIRDKKLEKFPLE